MEKFVVCVKYGIKIKEEFFFEVEFCIKKEENTSCELEYIKYSYFLGDSGIFVQNIDFFYLSERDGGQKGCIEGSLVFDVGILLYRGILKCNYSLEIIFLE